MTTLAFNAVHGLSVGEGTPITVITEGGAITGTTITGVLTTAAQPNITTVGSLDNLVVSGNIVAAGISGNGSGLSAIPAANITGTLPGAALSGTYDINVTGSAATANSVAGANVVGAVASATVAGTVTEAAQPNITSVGSLTGLTVVGLTTVGNVVSGNITASGAISGSTLGGTLTGAAQPNVTSVGSLTGLTVGGNIEVTGGGRTITADWSNADLNSRTRLVTSTADSNTAVYITPSGSAVNSGIASWNTANVANGSYVFTRIDDTGAQVISSNTGSAPVLPLSLVVGNTPALTVQLDGSTDTLGGLRNVQQIVAVSSNYTLTSDDWGKLIVCVNESDIIITVPDILGRGSSLDIVRYRPSNVTLTASGVDLYATPGLKLRSQWSAATLIKISSSPAEYLLVGDLSA